MVHSKNNMRLAVATKLAERGLRLFPLRPNTKLPSIKSWQAAATVEPAKLARWFGKGERNIGVSTDGLIVIDTDEKDGRSGYANLLALAADNAADLANTFTVESPTGSKHFYFAGSPVANSVGKLAEAIDVRSKGGLVVAPGSTINGVPYRVINSAPVAEVPQWLIDAISAAYVARPDKQQMEAIVELDTEASVNQALTYLADAPASVEGQGGNDNAYKVACRLRDIGISESYAFEVLDLLSDWNTRCSPPWAEDELQKVIGNAYSYAENSAGVASVEVDFDDVSDWEPPTADNDNASEDDSRGIKILFDEDIGNSPSDRREYVIKGVLSVNDLAVIFGKPGAGKSLLAPYLGHHVCRGAAVFGCRTKQRPVLYIAAEDQAGMSMRIKALHQQHGMTKGFGLMYNVSNLVNQKGKDYRRVLKAVRELQPGIVFIDTLAMAFPGIDENSGADMGKVIDAGRKLAIAAHGATVLIHHDTKAAGDTPRGHSALDGALDMRLKLTRDANTGIISCKLGKNRNGSLEAMEPTFKIGVANFGIDEDGDPITAAYAREAAKAEATPRDGLTRAEKGALDLLSELAAEDDASFLAWRAICVDDVSAMSALETKDSRQRIFRRCLTSLLSRKIITKHGDRVRLTASVSDFDLIEDGAFPDEKETAA